MQTTLCTLVSNWRVTVRFVCVLENAALLHVNGAYANMIESESPYSLLQLKKSMLLVGSGNLVSVTGPLTCITQNLIRVLLEVLLYSCAGANGIMYFLPIDEVHS